MLSLDYMYFYLQQTYKLWKVHRNISSKCIRLKYKQDSRTTPNVEIYFMCRIVYDSE